MFDFGQAVFLFFLTQPKSAMTKNYRVLRMYSYIMTVTTLTMAAACRHRTRPIRLLMKMRLARPTRMTRPMKPVSHIVADRLLVVKRKRKSKGGRRGGRTLLMRTTLQWTTDDKEEVNGDNL